MNLVFCMAGIYRRFREAGYATPKYLLSWGERTVLHAVMEPLLMKSIASVVLVANRRDESFAPDIHAAMASFGIPKHHLLWIPDTRGQAETAALGCRLLDTAVGPSDRRVLFHNIDTVVEGRDLALAAQTLETCAGWIDTFESDSPAYSYVSLGDDGLVADIAEKKVISPFATTGLYGFASMDDFVVNAGKTAPDRNEVYISDVYKRMLADGMKIAANLPATLHRTTILGTPAEYESARELGT
jgi:dTDP-glucose pyrophosphorylase